MIFQSFGLLISMVSAVSAGIIVLALIKMVVCNVKEDYEIHQERKRNGTE